MNCLKVRHEQIRRRFFAIVFETPEYRVGFFSPDREKKSFFARVYQKKKKKPTIENELLKFYVGEKKNRYPPYRRGYNYITYGRNIVQ